MRQEVKGSKIRRKKNHRRALSPSGIMPFPKNGSSLSLAYQLTQRASRMGFDWPNISGIFEKLEEEIMELKEALSLQNRRRVREEMGDLLFVMANISRFLRIDPEEALRRTLKKFNLRFQYIETSLHRKGKSFRHSNLIEMDQLWEEAKKREKK